MSDRLHKGFAFTTKTYVYTICIRFVLCGHNVTKMRLKSDFVSVMWVEWAVN